MVVVDFQDGHLVRAAHGLIQLVVIHEDELARDFLDEVRLGKDAAERAVLVDDGEDECGAVRCRVACLGEAQVFLKREKIHLDHAACTHGAAAHEHAGRGVGRRGDERHARGACRDFHVGLDGVAAGHDDGVRAEFDRALLDVWAVADEDDDLAPGLLIFLQPRAEAVLLHRADEQEELLLGGRELAADELAAHGARDGGERRDDGPRCASLFARWEKVVHDLVGIQQARAAAAIIHDRQAAQLAEFDELDGFVNRRVHMHAHHVWLHHVMHARAQVAEQHGRLDAETVEREINPRIRRPASGGNHIGPAAEPLEFRAADGRADRIHVWILVADDDGLHGAEKSRDRARREAETAGEVLPSGASGACQSF